MYIYIYISFHRCFLAFQAHKFVNATAKRQQFLLTRQAPPQDVPYLRKHQEWLTEIIFEQFTTKWLLSLKVIMYG